MQHFSGSYKASTVDIVDGMNLSVVAAIFFPFKVQSTTRRSEACLFSSFPGYHTGQPRHAFLHLSFLYGWMYC